MGTCSKVPDYAYPNLEHENYLLRKCIVDEAPDRSDHGLTMVEDPHSQHISARVINQPSFVYSIY